MKELIEENKIRLRSAVTKLVTQLSKKGIFFCDKDGDLPNVMFFNDDRKFCISWTWFYRVNGISSFRKDIGEHGFELVPMSDDMFMNSFTKSIIEFVFFPPVKKKV